MHFMNSSRGIVIGCQTGSDRRGSNMRFLIRGECFRIFHRVTDRSTSSRRTVSRTTKFLCPVKLIWLRMAVCVHVVVVSSFGGENKGVRFKESFQQVNRSISTVPTSFEALQHGKQGFRKGYECFGCVSVAQRIQSCLNDIDRLV